MRKRLNSILAVAGLFSLGGATAAGAPGVWLAPSNQGARQIGNASAVGTIGSQNNSTRRGFMTAQFRGARLRFASAILLPVWQPDLRTRKVVFGAGVMVKF